MATLHEINEKLYKLEELTKDEAFETFSSIAKGEQDPIVISSFLTALKIKKPSVTEIAGAADAMLSVALPFPAPSYDFGDIVGTGGDGASTINISSTAGLVCASLGVKVAKHGNTSVSSKSGASDVLKEIGFNLMAEPEVSRRMLDEANYCFAFAPKYHSAMRFVGPVRKALATRTIFNILGPLMNPMHTTFGSYGVYSKGLIPVYAGVLAAQGYKSAEVTWGSGLDEVAIHAPTVIQEVRNGKLTECFTVTSSDFGLQEYTLDDIRGGDPAENKKYLLDVVSGKGKEAHCAAVAANAAMLIRASGLESDLKKAASMALEAMHDGRAMKTIEKAIAISNGQA